MAISLILRSAEGHPLLLERQLQQQAGRDIGLGGDGLALEVGHGVDGAIGDDAVATDGLVDGADDHAGRRGIARAALVLADSAHVHIDVAAGHGGHDVGAVILELEVDIEAGGLEIAEVLGDEDRREAEPGGCEDADGVGGAGRAERGGQQGGDS